MRFGSRGPSESPGRSSRILHRNAMTERAWEDAVNVMLNFTVWDIYSFASSRGMVLTVKNARTCA